MIQSFAPIVSNSPVTLILGTMPGIASLKQQQYYGHPRNHFWKIIAHLFNNGQVPEDYNRKKDILLQHNLALWDVLAFCERNGSLDSNIKNPVPNKILQLLNEKPSIKSILFNGKASHRLFFKYFEPIEGIQYHVLPSTSPAYTMKFENKLALWKNILL